MSAPSLAFVRMKIDSLEKAFCFSFAVHILFVAFLLLSGIFHWFGPNKPSKVTWVRFSKGFTGEQGTPFKNTKAMPQTTIREAKEILKTPPDLTQKEVPNVGAPTQQPESVAPKIVPQETPKTLAGPTPEAPQKVTVAARPQPTKEPVKPKPLSNTEKTIRDALAKVKQELKEREGTEGRPVLEAAQVKQPHGGQSTFGSLEGPTDDLSPELLAYFNEIKKRINKEWVTMPKSFEASDKTVVKIVVTIDAKGKVVATEWEVRSGNYSFDLSAQRAILRASPFPSPPESIRDEVLNEGFLIEFNPRRVLN